MKSEIERLHNVNQLILDSVAEGIYGIDLNAKVIFWNRAAQELTGYQITDFEETNLHDLIHHTNKDGKCVPVVDCPVYHALNNGESLFVEDDIFWRKDGTSFPVEFSINPMLEKEKHVGTVITFRDMTEKKKTEELLQQSEKLSVVGQMAAGIAHEIRNPITSLKGFLQLIKSTQEFKDHYFEIMDSEFDRIESIIKELLVFSKPHESHFAYYEVQDLIQQVTLLMEPQAIIKNISITMELEVKPVRIFCIEYQIKQVLINLIKNAIEAMNEGGEILISLKVEKDEVVLIIKDEGIGISKEAMKKLGDPFYTTKSNGTGLGIMVTNNIIKKNHKGSIAVQSKVNEGTSFTIKLPIKP